MNSYDLSRAFWDYSFENPDKVKPYHAAIYFFSIEHCNRLGWKKKFGFPTSMVLEATGIKSYSSYKKYFDDLVEWGFFKVVEYSKNQYSSNIIELSLNVKALVKALDNAFVKHNSKQVESIGSIDKQLTKNQRTIIQDNIDLVKENIEEWINKANNLGGEANKDVVESIYSLYPSRCPIRKASTGKSLKANSAKIKVILKTKSTEDLTKIIETYLKQCSQDKSYLMNFGTFLNNLPDDSVVESPKEKLWKVGWKGEALQKVGYDKMMQLKRSFDHPGFEFKAIEI